MTSSPLHTISRNAAHLLKRRGYHVAWSISLREWDSPETFVCKRGAGDTLHVKLKLSPNTLTNAAEMARYCDDEIRTLRRLMRNNPNPAGENYEVWVLMPVGNYSVIEVQPDTLIDWRSGTVMSPLATRGVLG